MWESTVVEGTGPRFVAITTEDDPTCDMWLNLAQIVAFSWHGEPETGNGTVHMAHYPGVLKINRESYEDIMHSLINENGGWR